MLPADNNFDPFGLRRAAETVRRGPNNMKFLFVFVGVGTILSFLVLASIAPQIGDRLGLLSVKKQTQVSQAATIPSPGPYSRISPCPPYGDVNGDKYADVKDSLQIMRYADGLTTNGTFYPQFADVDADGKITKADAQMIMSYEAYVIKTFPVCSKTPA